MYYHVYALDFFLHARILAARNGVAVPEEFEAALREMAAALAALSRGGAPPRFGDDDGGRVFDGARNRPEHMLDPLATAAALFPDAGFKAAANGLREETLWLLGPVGETAFDGSAEAAQPGEEAVPRGGIHVLGSGPAQLFIDAGEQGSLAAGHGHADALSVQLAAHGRLWLGDPGTFCYIGEAGERDAFRGTRAHNTMTVDGLDQADPRGPFAWGPRPQVTVRRWESQEGCDLFEGEHSGYARLAEPVTHRRWVVRFGAALWLVRDVAEGRGRHELEIAWHFAPEAIVTSHGPAVVACLGGESLALVPAEDEAWERSLEMGVYSPVYGQWISAAVALWKTRAALPAEFAVVLGFGADAATARLERRGGGEPGSADYEYSSGDARRVFHFSASGLRWG